LGLQPLANNFLREQDLGKQEPRVSLRLFVCQSCWLVQIDELVPPVDLFSEYLYFSSFSDAMLRHAAVAASRYILDFELKPKSLVIEIASNDGYLLEKFVAAGVPALGIEPAANIAKVARKKGIETLTEFFGPGLAQKLNGEGRTADLILANNVFAHVPDINGFAAGLKCLLKPTGTAIIEFPYLLDLLEKSEFDTIYHEHVFYFSTTALKPLFERHSLSLHRVERLPIHGGSLRLFIKHANSVQADDSVNDLLTVEERAGLKTLQRFDEFSRRVPVLKSDLVSLITRLRKAGKTVAAYGASAKGSTLLNYLALDANHLDFVADRSTYKQGLFTPGTHIPIVAPDELKLRRPDYTLLLTWNFAEEILAQQKDYREAGGKFIIPIPEVKVV
jgi:SAM-dependent methyltransferase